MDFHHFGFGAVAGGAGAEHVEAVMIVIDECDDLSHGDGHAHDGVVVGADESEDGHVVVGCASGGHPHGAHGVSPEVDELLFDVVVAGESESLEGHAHHLGVVVALKETVAEDHGAGLSTGERLRAVDGIAKVGAFGRECACHFRERGVFWAGLGEGHVLGHHLLLGWMVGRCGGGGCVLRIGDRGCGECADGENGRGEQSGDPEMMMMHGVAFQKRGEEKDGECFNMASRRPRTAANG